MTFIIPDPPLSDYSCYHRPGDVFMVCATLQAEPVFGQTGMAHLLRSVLREVHGELCFRMHGWAVLPDQFQLLLHPAQSASAEQIMRRVRYSFQADYPQVRGLPASIAVWERRHLIEPLPDVAAFAHSLDSLHYAPVAQRLCARPEEWPQTSYSAWVERRLYKLGWGWAVPERLNNKVRAE